MLLDSGAGRRVFFRVRYGTGMLWYGMVCVRYGMVWYDTVRYGTVRYSMVRDSAEKGKTSRMFP